MSSFAIWYKPKIGSNTKIIDVEVHLNLWKLKGKENGRKSVDHFLDIGLMLENSKNASSLNIFVPYIINRNEIIDLGSSFKKHTDLVPTVFNRDYVVKTTQTGKSVEVLNRDNEFQFNIYMLDINTDIEIQDKYNGSIIRIDIPDDINKGKIYYRLRIISKAIESLSEIDKPANAIFEGAFSSTELVDFRLNEKRNLHNSLLDEIHREGQVNFKPLHLFLMREASYDYIFSSRSLYRIRELEKDLWNSYVGSKYSFDRIVAYQWMEPSSESFNVFVKFKFRKSNLLTILSFLGWALLIAVVGGAMGGLLVQWILGY